MAPLRIEENTRRQQVQGAVRHLTNAILARAGLQDPIRPIGSFLFLR